MVLHPKTTPLEVQQDVHGILVTVLCQKLILGACRIICINFDVSDCLLMFGREMLLFVESNTVSPPHITIVFCFNIASTVPVIKNIPDHAQVVFLRNVVLDVLRLGQT